MTTSTGIKVNRETLYEQVWAEPMITLAKKYGISDVGLKKVCRKLQVPVPPRGYWARLQHGKRVKKIPLPSIPPGHLAETMIKAPHVPSPEPNLPVEVTAQMEYEQNPAHRIVVPDRLHSPHPLVKITADLLSKISPDDYGRLRPWRRRHLDIRVGPKSLARALRLMNALLQALAARGFPTTIVEATYHKFPETFVSVLGEKVQIALEEETRRAERMPTAEEKEKHKHDPSWKPYPRWTYTPTGRFTLKIHTYWCEELRKTWSDGKSGRIEERLNGFIVGLVAIGYCLKQRRLKKELEEQEEAERKRQQLEVESRRREQQAKSRHLEQQAVAWANADFIRRFIAEVQRRATSQWGQNQIPQDMEDWLTWAKGTVDRLDPLTGGLDGLLKEHALSGTAVDTSLKASSSP